jgi:hypothetical protein
LLILHQREADEAFPAVAETHTKENGNFGLGDQKLDAIDRTNS